MLRTTIGLRKTVPSRMERICPFGEGHSFLSEYSFTRSASGVMVAHLTPTPWRLIACPASVVTRSSVSSRCFTPRSKYFRSTSRYGRTSFCLIIPHRTRVISSPSISTIGFFTLILAMSQSLPVGRSLTE